MERPAFQSFLYSLSIRFCKFGTLPCLILTWGSDIWRSISGHNMNTSIGLHIRSTSGVSRDNQRIQQFLQCREAHMQKVLCPNSTATRVLLFGVVGQWTKYWEQRFACENPSRCAPNGLRLLITRECLETRNRKLDETARRWNIFTQRHVRNGSLSSPVLKWPGYKQEDRGIVGAFPADMIYDIWYMIHDTWYTIWYDIWYDMIYDMIWYDMIWYDMIWYDMIWYDMIYDMWCDVMWCDVMWYDMIFLSTEIGLTPGGSSTVYIYTQTIHRTNK